MPIAAFELSQCVTDITGMSDSELTVACAATIVAMGLLVKELQNLTNERRRRCRVALQDTKRSRRTRPHTTHHHTRRVHTHLRMI